MLVAHAAGAELIRVDDRLADVAPGLAGATVGSASSAVRAACTCGSARNARAFSRKIR